MPTQLIREIFGQERLALLAAVVEHSGEFIGICTPDFKPLYVNAAGLEMVGLKSVEDAQALPVVEFFWPEDRERIERDAIPALLKDGAWSGEVRFRNFQTGEPIETLWNAFAIYNEQGAPIAYATVSPNLAPLMASSRALRESEMQFRTLANSISHLAWMARPDGHIFWYNQRWFDYTGATLDEMQGWGWQSVHDPRELPRVLEGFRRALATGESFEQTFPLRRHDGEFRWHLTRALPVRDASGEITLWFGTNTDITEQRELETALRESDRRKDDFLAMLGHELRNPLAGIVSGAEALGQLDLGPEAEEMQQIITRQAGHMSRIVDDLLDISRIARGKLTLESRPVELRRLLQNVVTDYLGGHRLHNCQLRCELPGEDLWVLGDPTRLSQAVLNLVHNAVKFSDGPNAVTVGCRARAGEQIAEVAVSDLGIGMTPEMLDQIFEPFTQADNSLQRARGGLGLGLALVKGIVELHGGKTTAHSPGLGQGTRIQIELPLTRSESAVALERSAGEVGPLRILLIDDRRDAILPLQRILERQGHLVATAMDGPGGIDKALNWRPDIILCDIGLPESMSGYEVALALRKRPEFAETYLVAVSGYGREEDRMQAQSSGFDYHLTKPVGVEMLRDLVERRPRF